MNTIRNRSFFRAFATIASAIPLCLTGAATLEAATLKLVDLKCYDTQDAIPPVDECLLKVTGGGVNRAFNNDMSVQESWAVNQEIAIVAPVTVRLFDRDNGGAVDLLGQVVIPAAPTAGTRSVVFQLAGARYKLRFRVEP